LTGRWRASYILKRTLGSLNASFGPARRRSFHGRWRLGVWLLVAATLRCSSSSNPGVCGSITSHRDGIHLSDCSNGTVTLADVQYDRNGKVSYDFVVTCHGQSARGSWSRTSGLKCFEGATDPCKSGGVCTPTSDVDCQNIANCKEWGDCGYLNGKCVPTEEGCARSNVPCGLFGKCHLGPDGVCVVLSDADCQSPFGVCPDCKYQGACATYGTCYEANGACVARDSADCKRSEHCAFAGTCSVLAGKCAAVTDGDCLGSEVCRTARQCTAVDGICSVKPPP
jgi:hypothetical protein